MSDEKKIEEKTALDNDVKALETLQGFGQKLNVFTGMKDDGKTVEWKTYHIAPVPIKDIPKLTGLLISFQEAAEKAATGAGSKGLFKEKDTKAGAQMILMGLTRTMPDVKEEEIMENFSFGVMLKASRILIDVNDLGVQVDTEGNVVENPTMPIRRVAPN